MLTSVDDVDAELTRWNRLDMPVSYITKLS